jgi:hypothetical protein
MRLVPRQLQRSGMTGNVPYYGGRLSPAQAYAASHPTAAPPPGVPRYSGRMTPGQALAVSHPPGAPFAPMPAAAPVPAADRDALRRLAASGVITPAELAAIEGRMA